MSPNLDMNMLEQKGNHGLHAVIVPVPAQGHVNALMNLAQLLVIRGCSVTFVNTDWTHKRVAEASKDDKSLVSRDDPEWEQHGQKIRFLSISDGLPPNHGRNSNPSEFVIALQNLGPALEDLLTTTNANSPSFPPITFIITDAFMSCTEQVASNMKVPRVIFWPLCAASSVSQCYAHLLLSEGHIPVTEKEAKNSEKFITCLPGNIPPLRPTDLLSFYRAEDQSDILLNACLHASQKQSKGDYTLVNTFEELEGRDAVTALALNGCPALAIGPLFLPNFLEGRSSGCSLWEEEQRCLSWLDMQQTGSVIYVSFGSIAVKSQQQLEQLALGLEGCGQPFLWVLRLDIAEGEAAILPAGFEERTQKRAMFVRFAKEVWKIGLDFENVDVDCQKVVTNEEVEDVVRRMMRTAEGRMIRDNIVKLKESATKAVLPGGSSFLNLNTFVNDMTMIKVHQSKIETM
eukprot:PITA_34252